MSQREKFENKQNLNSKSFSETFVQLWEENCKWTLKFQSDEFSLTVFETN